MSTRNSPSPFPKRKVTATYGKTTAKRQQFGEPSPEPRGYGDAGASDESTPAPRAGGDAMTLRSTISDAPLHDPTRHVGSHLPQRGTKRRLSDIYAGADVFDEATASDGNKTLPRKLSNRPTGFSGVISDRPATDDAMDKRRQGEDIVSRRRERDGSNPATTTQRRGNTGNYYTSDKLGDRRHHRPLSTTGQDDTTLRNGLDDRPRNSTGDTTPQRQARTSPNRRQRKLIDTLAAQSAGRSSSVERSRLTTATTRDSENMIESEISLDGTLPAHIKDGPTFTQVAPVKVQSVRHTYGQQRTILADGDHRDPADLARKPDWETEKDEHDFLMSMPIHETVALESDIEDDLAASEGAIRSVHELRQAGANTLVADGMNDLVDRIGKASVKPSTLRRNALLELAHKMNDKSFSRQFRDQDFDSELFRDLDTEKDTIAAYTLVAILVMQLSVSPGAHITHQLGQNGLGNLFRKMLDTGVDITTIARDRQSNTTKFTQGSLERLKSYILKLSIWMDRPPARLSPRTLALKCLQLLGPRAQERRLFPPVVVDQLFQVLSESLTSDPWGQDVDDTIDFSIALFIIESISIVAMETGSAAKWTADYIPIVADVFSASLRRPGVTPDELDLLILRLVLNTTNNNSAGVDVFVLGGILADLLQSVCRHFLIVLRSVADQDLTKERLDGLLLMLGVVINFVEHSMDVRRAFDEHHGHEASSLDTLIGIFLDNHMATSEADSMEKSQLNVALSYLSILLGYLCLSQPIRARFTSRQAQGSVEPLLTSMREFISHSKKVEGDASDHQAGYTARLESLVTGLRKASLEQNSRHA